MPPSSIRLSGRSPRTKKDSAKKFAASRSTPRAAKSSYRTRTPKQKTSRSSTDRARSCPGARSSSILIPEEETAQEKLEREEKEKKEIEKGKTPKEVAGKFEKEELEEFCSTAVNDKNGNLYVADGGTYAIYPFDKEGHQVFRTNKEGKKIAGAEITGKETPAGEFGEELSIAIDQKAGRLYVSDRENEVVDYFNEAGKYEGQLAFPGSAENQHLPGALAVNQATGELYVSVLGQAIDEAENESFAFIYAFSSSGQFLREISGQRSGAFPGFGAERSEEALLTGVAVGPEGNVYASDSARRVVFEFDGSGHYIGELTGTPSGAFSEPAGVALNKAGNVYVLDRTETRNVERLRAGLGLEPLPGALDVFGPAEVSGQPTIDSESVSNVTATSATLHAGIDPTGVQTAYYFELCRDASCVDLPTPPGTAIGAGEVTKQVSEAVSGLAANTIYTYRVVATFAGGASTVLGATQTFTTGTEGASVKLPDGRAWELVSSPEKRGAGLESIPREGGLIQASEDGTALTYIALAPDEANPEGNRVPTFTQLLSKRGGDASGGAQWLHSDITLPGEGATGAVTGNGKQEYRAFTPDLGLSLVEPLGLGPKAEPRLSPEDTERTIYTRQTESCEAPPSSCYTPLVTAANDTAGTKFGGAEGKKRGVEFVNASPDLSHVLLNSLVPLTEEPVNAGHTNVYEWWAGALHLVNILPEGVSEEEGSVPEVGHNHVLRHAISDDGSRVIFTFGKHLFVRDMIARVTTQVDGPTLLGPERQANYQTASSDGTKIFFTDEAKLTEKSSGASGVSDLYEFDLNTHTLTDISVDPSFKATGEFADVKGLVPGASEDGSTVYFVANGVLTTAPNASGESARPGHCHTIATEREEETPSNATCNLYVKHGSAEGEQPTFIGRLSSDDLPDWENTNGNLEYVTSKVSPNGRYLAFMSSRRLTGYDNRDTSPAAHEAADEEVFLYDGAERQIACASCNPDGSRPSGVFDGGEASTAEGIGLLIDRKLAWEGRWLAGDLPGWTGTEGQTAIYQSRYLNDNGRLFFNSPEPLAHADTNKATDVYEYEPSGIGGCEGEGGCIGLISSGSSAHESAFLDASATGDDVFFLTAATLVSTDRDRDFDVYDARVCGSAGCIVPPETTATSCNSIEECRPSTPSIPPFPAPPGVTTPSSGNVPGQSGVLPAKVSAPAKHATKPTRKQRLAKALKACHKLKKKKKRQACERKARRRYGTKKTHKNRRGTVHRKAGR